MSRTPSPRAKLPTTGRRILVCGIPLSASADRYRTAPWWRCSSLGWGTHAAVVRAHSPFLRILGSAPPMRHFPRIGHVQ
ncbi:hypothetical protein B0H12DRAFT_206767 [Mycena haematopus]|nr:hypothetical protein B0H12DRAFT_377347 [Mycena haematopus]KAJ7231730.1 hypothetical protein B0H12DRAFT_206767 [Mycena haematopus]